MRSLSSFFLILSLCALMVPEGAWAGEDTAPFKLVGGLYARIVEEPSGLFKAVITVQEPGSLQAVEAFVEQGGGVVQAVHGRRIQVEARGRLLWEVACLDGVLFVSPVRRMVKSSATVHEYLPPVRGLESLHSYGFTGAGVKVGIIDGGFYGYESLVGEELPAGVHAISFRNDGCGVSLCPGFSHGTAVAEVVHQVAPGAELYLVSVETDLEFQQAIDWLESQGVSIVNGSVGFLACGPRDGTSTCSQAAASLWDRGVLPVFSAGNDAEDHWMGTPRDSDGDGRFEFEDGVELLMFSVYRDGEVRVVVNWDDWGDDPALPASDQDIDFHVLAYDLDSGRMFRVASSLSEQAGLPGEAPVEQVSIQASASRLYFLYLEDYSTTREFVVDITVSGDYVEMVEPANPSGSVLSPADSPKVLAVGASTADGTVHPYSAQGPLWNGYYKPDVVAVSGLDTVTYGERGFYGTSASAPVVAGIAALFKQIHPSWGPSQLARAVEIWAVDVEQPGQDLVSGCGLVSAESALASLSPLPSGQGLFLAARHDWSGVTVEMHDDTFLAGVFTFLDPSDGGRAVWYGALGHFGDHMAGPASLVAFRRMEDGGLDTTLEGELALLYGDGGAVEIRAVDTLNRELFRWSAMPSSGLEPGEGTIHWWSSDDVPYRFLFSQSSGAVSASILYYFDDDGLPVWSGAVAPTSSAGWYWMSQWAMLPTEDGGMARVEVLGGPVWLFMGDGYLSANLGPFGPSGIVELFPARF